MDDVSFEAFVRREHGRLFRTALLLCGNEADAADLAQTALARLYPRWRRLSGDQPLAYARRIIVNAHHDRWRRAGRREVLPVICLSLHLHLITPGLSRTMTRSWRRYGS